MEQLLTQCKKNAETKIFELIVLKTEVLTNWAIRIVHFIFSHFKINELKFNSYVWKQYAGNNDEAGNKTLIINKIIGVNKSKS